MAANFHVRSQDYDVEGMRTADRKATLYITEASGERHDIDLERAQYCDGIFTAEARTFFMRPTVVVRVSNANLYISIRHSVFADGEHTFGLNPSDLKQVTAFFEEFAA